MEEKMKKRLPYNRINQIVFEHLHKYSIDTFVETGTYRGGGISNAMPQAKEIYSIELDEERYSNAKTIFEQFPNVHILHGDSAKVLPEIMPKLAGRCLFWLDAHYRDDCPKDTKETPILDELRCVLKYQYPFIILIDDARLYNGEGGWPPIGVLKTIIIESCPDATIEVKDDIIRVIPKNITATAEDDYISMSNLGKYGRFGNQLFQYAALKIYAWLNGLRVEVPAGWIGRKLFMGCNDISDISATKQKDLDGECIWLSDQKLKGYDIKGYCQYHTSHYAAYKYYVRSLFRYMPQIEDALRKPIEPLMEFDLIGIHIRLSDYRLPGRNANITPMRWYLEWLEKNWGRFDHPTLFIASDEIDNIRDYFRQYYPQYYPAGMDFIYDHYALSHCDCLLTSNSTFSFTAAMLNEQGREFYRPDFEQKKMVSFDPWDSEPLLKPI